MIPRHALIPPSSLVRARAAALLLGVSGALAPSCAPSPRAAPATISERPVAPAPRPAPVVPAPVILSTELWSFEGKDGVLVRTPSYRVYTTATRYAVAERVPVFLERALIHYSTHLADLPRPAEVMETYLMASRPQWARVTQRVMGRDAEVYLRIPRGGFAANGRAILYDIGPSDTFAITAHEGWHQYTQKTFRSPLPVSFEEGLATYMEGFRWADQERLTPTFLPWKNIERFEKLRRAHAAGELMPLERLQQTTPQDIIGDDPDAALVYYAQVWAMIHFLAEGEDGRHRAGLRQLLEDAASGDLGRRIRREAGGRAASSYQLRRTGVDLFPIYFGGSAAEFDASYRAFIAQVVRVGSRERVVAGRSPITE
ncbi:MAG: hypothetical protein SFY69_05085 [Planctomycetota bacterium]|nr:hypothetical protein [Planctomycetota bacterium]